MSRARALLLDHLDAADVDRIGAALEAVAERAAAPEPLGSRPDA